MRKKLAFLLILAFIMVAGGCGTVETDKPTETTAEDDNLLDSDGFRAVKDYVVTLQNDVNVRKTPETSGEIYITLDAGVNLNRTGVKDGWARVLINGGIYYVESRFVEETTIKWATETDVEKVSHIVFIDPAKQITEDLNYEPMSPEVDAPELTDSGEYATATSAQMPGMKKKMTAGAIGVNTGNFEYDVTMSVANYLNAELVKRGYTVFLSRSTNNVNISNAKRAQMANASSAEIYIKLEAPKSNDPSASGILGFIATSTNSHTGAMYQKNYELCYDVLQTTCEQTGATRMGIYETDNLTSLNYCNMPATVLSVGFLSNNNDDIALSMDDYKKKIAIGIANGIDEYFESIDN
ncbi:MAG: N-acetylmuramoyl-L-alanine amidase [Eubacterium sp.]|nr:N-acetylmuramoyl-L-alanine amidase [Eubacterium sp.]